MSESSAAANGGHRLVTRGDFDGVVCAALLRERGLIDDISFVHPKDMQDGKVAITANDIIANLPHVDGCHMSFDHHASELLRNAGQLPDNCVNIPDAPSAARVVYEHFGGASAFPNIPADLMEAVDKADAAQFSEEEVLNPSGWVLLNFVMDSRTGLGRFRDFTVNNYEFLLGLVDQLRTKGADEVLLHHDVSERVRVYFEHETYFRDQLRNCSSVRGNVVTVDLRGEETIYAGNRFMVYALFPDTNVSIHALPGHDRTYTAFAVGRSIINRSCTVDVGALCLKNGGGGHAAAGTCQVGNDRADAVLAELQGALA